MIKLTHNVCTLTLWYYVLTRARYYNVICTYENVCVYYYVHRTSIPSDRAAYCALQVSCLGNWGMAPVSVTI